MWFVVAMVLSLLVGLWYNIYLVKKYGATPGKLAMKIRLVMMDGSPVTIAAASKRYSVLFVLGLLGSVALVIGVFNVAEETYQSSGWFARQVSISMNAPVWNKWVEVTTQIWIWSEFITMLFNKKRRAVHDFMAGTVVIRTEKQVASESV
jgi:uncharacterized RDD family membrane protein YckC